MHLSNHLMSTVNNDTDDFDIDYQKQRSLGDLFEYLKQKKEKVSSLWQEIQVNDAAHASTSSERSFLSPVVFVRMWSSRRSFSARPISSMRINNAGQARHHRARAFVSNYSLSTSSSIRPSSHGSSTYVSHLSSSLFHCHDTGQSLSELGNKRTDGIRSENQAVVRQIGRAHV